jgi:hypothetical protein
MKYYKHAEHDTTADVVGFNVYRWCPGDATPALRESLPTTEATSYRDVLSAKTVCRYSVRPLLVVETDEAFVKSDGSKEDLLGSMSLSLIWR